MQTTTTITVNGSDGARFLSSLIDTPGRHLQAPRMPAALVTLVEGANGSIEVAAEDAAEIAAFVDELLDAGWIAVASPPLLFSPAVGDVVAIARDLLVEVEQQLKGPRTWRFIGRGVRGRLVDWRTEDLGRVAFVDGTRQVALIRRDAMTRTWLRRAA
jgi:hypothetical protein